MLSVLCISLGGCASDKEDTSVIETPPLHGTVTDIQWEGLSLQAITPVCSYELQDSDLDVFPFNDNDAHITMKKILFSGNGFWDTVIREYVNTDNLVVTDKYTYVTFTNGATYGLLMSDVDYGYLVFTESLPSSYVKLVLDTICNTSS